MSASRLSDTVFAGLLGLLAFVIVGLPLSAAETPPADYQTEGVVKNLPVFNAAVQARLTFPLAWTADRFPDSLQPFIRALPLTAVIDSLRGNMIQGLPIAQLGWQVAVMMCWLILGFFTALKLFRWR